MTPTQQVEKRVKDLQSSDPRVRAFFEDEVIEYKNFLITKGYRANTVKTRINRVQSFFAHNRLKLQFARGDLKVEDKQKVVTKWIPDNIEIRAMYSLGSVRDRSLLLTLYQSGLSEIDASSLNIEDLNDIYNHDEGQHLYIEKFREKTNIPQRTCISIEAIHDIKLMLRERGNPKEGALFVSQKGQRLITRFIAEAMTKLCEKAHGDKAKQFKTKSLRSSYNDALLRADIKQEIKDLMMGHKRAGARGHYECSPTTIKEAYEKAFKYLSINHGTQARKDLERIENSLIGLSTTITKQQQKITELTDYIVEIDEALLHHRSKEFREIYQQIKKDLGKKIEKNAETLMRIVKFIGLDKETES